MLGCRNGHAAVGGHLQEELGTEVAVGERLEIAPVRGVVDKVLGRVVGHGVGGIVGLELVALDEQAVVIAISAACAVRVGDRDLGALDALGIFVEIYVVV